MARLTKHQVREQKRLHDQLDFFGAKKKRFISVYANKPRIRVSNKSKEKVPSLTDLLEAKRKLLTGDNDLAQPERDALKSLYVRHGVAGIFSYAASEARARQAMAAGQQQTMDYQRMLYNQQLAMGSNGQMSTIGLGQSLLGQAHFSTQPPGWMTQPNMLY